MSSVKKKVLVIDDESEVRHLIRRVLQKMGHEVIEAADGADTMQLIRHERPDLVLLDIHMPKLDGIATMSDIRDVDPTLPVVMVTGDLDLERVKLALERGASEYITKPFDLQSLESSITGNLERRSTLQAAQARRKENHGS